MKETRVENPLGLHVGAATLAPDGSLLAVNDENFRVRLWQTSTGLEETNFIQAGAPIATLSFSPTGRILAGIEVQPTSSNRFVFSHRLHLWDGKLLAPLNPLVVPEISGINSFAFTPDDRFIATIGRDRIVYLLELSTRRLIGTFKGHRQQVQGLAFSPDGRLLATGSSDGTIKLWDVPLRRELGTLKFNESGTKGIDERVTTIAFSPDGGVLLATSQDGTMIRFFRAPTWEQIERAEKEAQK